MMTRSPGHVGEQQARDNLDTLNKYRGVFATTTDSTRYTSLMSLAVLFIPSWARNGDPSISLIDLMNRMGRLSTKSQEQIDELAKLQQEIKKYQQKINVLKSWRDQQLAHLDLNPDNSSMSDKGLEDLMELSIKIIALAEWCLEYKDLTLYQYQHNAQSHIAAEGEVDLDFDKLLNELQS